MRDYVNSTALQEYTTKLVAKLKTLFPGTPTAAATVADMTDHSKTYVYVGSETGYTAGDWYYWDGTAWTSGGPFQATSIITDTTLAVAGEAADAKATGDAIAAAKTAVLNAMAPAYSTSATYAVGDYVNYNGSIYRCTTAITTAESWTSGHWTAVTLGADLEGQVSDLKTQIKDITGTSKNLFNPSYLVSVAGWTENNGVYTGKASALYNHFFKDDTYYPIDGLEENKQYTFSVKAYTDQNAGSTGTGIQIAFNYSDGTRNAYNIPNSTATKTNFAFTSASGKNVSYITFAYGSLSSNIWHFEEAQLEEGAEQTEYVSHLTAFDSVAREKNTEQDSVLSNHGERIVELENDSVDYDNSIDNISKALIDINEKDKDTVTYILNQLTGTKTEGRTILAANDGHAYYIDAAASAYIIKYELPEVENIVVNGTAPNNGYLYTFEDINENIIDHYAEKNSGYSSPKNYYNIKVNIPNSAKYIVVSGRAANDSEPASVGIIEGYKNVDWDSSGYNPIKPTYTNKCINTAGASVNISEQTNSLNCNCYVIPCIAGDIFTINATGKENARAWAFIDSAGNVLKRSSEAVVINKSEIAPTNSAYLIINDYRNGVSFYWRTSAKTLIDEVTGTDYMQRAIKRITGELKGKSALGNILVFGFNTDQHIRDDDDTRVTTPVLRGLMVLSKLTHNYPYDFVCLGGDACEAGTYATSPDLILDEDVTVQKPLYDAWCPVVPIAGNHDAATNTREITGEMLFNVNFKRIVNSGFIDGWDTKHTNGYWDSKSHKIRVIFIDSTVRNEEGYDYTAIVNALNNMLSTTPQDYKIIVISHQALNNTLGAQWDTNIEGQTVLNSYASRIICCLCGHTHCDLSATSNGILYIATTTAQIANDADGNVHTIGTETETAFDNFVVDQNTKRIYAFRYGLGNNREFDFDANSPTFGEIT